MRLGAPAGKQGPSEDYRPGRPRRPARSGEPEMTSEPAGAARAAAAGRAPRRGPSLTTAIVAGAAAAALVVTLLLLSGGSSPAAPRALPAARNFTLVTLGDPGMKIALAGYAGRPVIVNFFASWCGPCQRETPLLARFYRASGGRIMIIGVDANDRIGPALKFVRRAGVTYPVGTDPYPAATTTSSWGVFALPQTFFLDSRHRIVKRVFGAVTMKDLSAGVAQMTGGRGSPPTASGSLP
jgi:cytochrome c biogenesis protein CcmG/thiol:disulfide interchange protein DsbE